MATAKKSPKSAAAKTRKSASASKTRAAASADIITPAIRQSLVRAEVYIFTALSVLFLALVIAKYA